MQSEFSSFVLLPKIKLPNPNDARVCSANLILGTVNKHFLLFEISRDMMYLEITVFPLPDYVGAYTRILSNPFDNSPRIAPT